MVVASFAFAEWVGRTGRRVASCVVGALPLPVREMDAVGPGPRSAGQT